jgi:hypothetical protein
MAIAGEPGASAGYCWNLEPGQVRSFNALKLRLFGTPGAQFYVNVFAGDRKTVLSSGRKDTPRQEQEVSFPIPAGREGRQGSRGRAATERRTPAMTTT